MRGGEYVIYATENAHFVAKLFRWYILSNIGWISEPMFDECNVIVACNHADANVCLVGEEYQLSITEHNCTEKSTQKWHFYNKTDNLFSWVTVITYWQTVDFG